MISTIVSLKLSFVSSSSAFNICHSSKAVQASGKKFEISIHQIAEDHIFRNNEQDEEYWNN